MKVCLHFSVGKWLILGWLGSPQISDYFFLCEIHYYYNPHSSGEKQALNAYIDQSKIKITKRPLIFKS